MKMRVRNENEIKLSNEVREKFENGNEFIWEVRYSRLIEVIHSPNLFSGKD